MKKVVLPSGRELEITLAPFADAKRLFQAVAGELKLVPISGSVEIDINFMKTILFSLLDSKRVDDALWLCLKRCVYAGLAIKEDSFEPEEARSDYLQVCAEVTKENILPFMSSLSAQFKDLSSALESLPEQRSQATTTQRK